MAGGVLPNPEFTELLAPGTIGTLALRNRILMCPMGDSLCEPDGTISSNQLAYYEARARGGAALLLVGSVSVAYPHGSFDDRQVAASDDVHLPGLSDLTDRVHRHGALIAAQLVHNGQMSLLDVARGVPMLVPSVPKPSNPDRITMMVSPDEMAAMISPYTQPTSKVAYRVMNEADIADVTTRFVEAAERCRRAGFDGIELHAGHGYLLDEFLTPSMNTRTDGWGGAVENRARFLLDVLRAIRVRMGPEFPLWIRINAVEHHKPDGETFADQLRVIDLCREVGIDAVHVTSYSNTDVATGPTDAYAPHTVGNLSDYAAAVRERVDVPVITFGRFEPDEANAVLREGKADFIAMGRRLLADPDLPNKLASALVGDIRPCIYQYRCIGNIFLRGPLRCVSNAHTGREHDLAAGATSDPRRILVIGGGPAGLEAAHTLAGQGHAVTLWERAARAGGVLVHAAAVDPVLDDYLGWLVRQVAQSSCAVELGTAATVPAVLAFGADEIVVATGAKWGVPDNLAVTGGVAVRTVEDVASVVGAGPQKVVLIGGGKPSMSIGQALLERGNDVTMLSSTNVFCGELGLPGRWRLVADFEASGGRLVGEATVERVLSGAVEISVRGADGVSTPEVIPSDVTLVTRDPAPETGLARELRAAGSTVHVIGDASAVRGIEGANLDVAELAVRLR